MEDAAAAHELIGEGCAFGRRRTWSRRDRMNIHGGTPARRVADGGSQWFCLERKEGELVSRDGGWRRGRLTSSRPGLAVWHRHLADPVLSVARSRRQADPPPVPTQQVTSLPEPPACQPVDSAASRLCLRNQG